jgi:proteic killer suppression protein
MDVEFANQELDRLETDLDFNTGFSSAVVRVFRKRMQMIRDAVDERAFYAMRSLHFEKLKGDRWHQHSMRLNRQWRLILELQKHGRNTVVVIVDIEDYH